LFFSENQQCLPEFKLQFKPKKTYDEIATVSTSTRKEEFTTTDAKQPSEMADVKHELKNVIFNRRLAKGLDELDIPVTADNKNTVEKLTEEEEERRQQRRERNKLAAAKCREKKKVKMERLSKEVVNLIEENEALANNIQNLQLEKEMLVKKLSSHHCVLNASNIKPRSVKQESGSGSN